MTNYPELKLLAIQATPVSFEKNNNAGTFVFLYNLPCEKSNKESTSVERRLMFIDVDYVMKLIKPEDRVLDIGGAEQVFPRANAVIDILPYEQRKPGLLKEMPEQFTRSDWYIGDICTPQVWDHFKDKEFDFVVCSHVLEDIRDPIYVCSQMIRVGKAGYIECPSRFRECAKGDPQQSMSGWDHHRWILDVIDGTLVFTPKFNWAYQFDYLGNSRRHYIQDYHFNFTAVHWIGSFDYVERVTRGKIVEAENQFYFYDNFSYDNPQPIHQIKNVAHKGKTFIWFSDYKLPIEEVLSLDEIIERYKTRTKVRVRDIPSLVRDALRRDTD